MKKAVSITFENYEDLEALAKERGLGTVANLARYAVKQYLSRSWSKKGGKLVSRADDGQLKREA